MGINSLWFISQKYKFADISFKFYLKHNLLEPKFFCTSPSSKTKTQTNIQQTCSLTISSWVVNEMSTRVSYLPDDLGNSPWGVFTGVFAGHIDGVVVTPKRLMVAVLVCPCTANTMEALTSTHTSYWDSLWHEKIMSVVQFLFEVWTKWLPFSRWQFQMYVLAENCCILVQISLEFASEDPTGKTSTLVQVMLWRFGDR